MKNSLLYFLAFYFISYQLYSQTDNTSPTLTGFSFTPTSVNVSNESQLVNFTVSAEDDLSGIKQVQVLFKSPNGTWRWSWVTNINSLSTTVSGDVEISQYDESGEWKARVMLVDNVGNQSIYEYDDLEQLSFTYSLIVNYTCYVNCKIFLEGTYNSSKLMNTSLYNLGKLPLSQPYFTPLLIITVLKMCLKFQKMLLIGY